MSDPQGQTAQFASIAGHLCKVGLSAPHVFARSPHLMLLEDFGDAQFANVIAKNPDQEIPLYEAATDVLCHLESAKPASGLSAVTPDVLGAMIDPAFTHYALSNTQSNDLVSCLTDLLANHLPAESVMVLRDYHAENMIWLPKRDGMRRVGLLDFQDALIGPPIYDLVSMLQDARRDVTPACTNATLAHYATQTGRSMDAILPAFHLLGIQRNLRILGIFARLAVLRGKPGYLGLIPRVWAHIEESLSAPGAAPLVPLIETLLPAPTPDHLRKIKAQCQTP